MLSLLWLETQQHQTMASSEWLAKTNSAMVSYEIESQQFWRVLLLSWWKPTDRDVYHCIGYGLKFPSQQKRSRQRQVPHLEQDLK